MGVEERVRVRDLLVRRAFILTVTVNEWVKSRWYGSTARESIQWSEKASKWQGYSNDHLVALNEDDSTVKLKSKCSDLEVLTCSCVLFQKSAEKSVEIIIISAISIFLNQKGALHVRIS